MTELPVPPEELRAGMGPFEDPDVFLQSGLDTLRLAERSIRLKPTDRVLDVGCGCGRIALPMLDFLAAGGRYEGFDVDSGCVDWCVRNIQERDERFRFSLLDVRSESYNPGGAIAPEAAEFPYADASFDRAIVSSVFTHMRQAGVERYLAELRRVVRPGGTVLVSVLLMNEATIDAIERATTLFSFVHALDGASWTLDPAHPLDAVSISDSWMRMQAAANDLEVEKVLVGTWRQIRSWQVQHDWLSLRRLEAR